MLKGQSAAKTIIGAGPKNGTAPARKLVIKPLKCKYSGSCCRVRAVLLTPRVCAAKPKLPADFESTTWAKLNEAVVAVNSKQGVSVSLEELYRVS